MNRKGIFLWLLSLVAPVFWELVPGLSVMGRGAPVCGAQTVTPKGDAGKAIFWDKLKGALNKKKEPDENWSSVTERYDVLYDWVHRDEVQLYDSLSKSGVANWDRYQNIVSVTYERGKDTLLKNNLAPNIKVFGWHPYWMGSAYKSYRFNLLSHVAWFSYNIDSTGENKDPRPKVAGGQYGKAYGELEALAHGHNCKVLITITNHTEAGNRALLGSVELQNTLIEDLLQVLETGKADGVDVNFELVPKGLKRPMSAFLQKLSERLKAKNKNYLLTVDLPAYDRADAYELPVLNRYVDLFVMTGYDYYNRYSRSDGPIAPLQPDNGAFFIRNSVDRYLQAGLEREKLLLALPYYGAVWTAASADPGAPDPTLKFKEHMTYRDIKNQYKLETRRYDQERWSAYYIARHDSNVFKKCWFDDTLTLRRKYDWVLREKLAGIGIWALGYDNGHPELWDLIETKFAADTTLAFKDAYLETRYFRLSKSISEYRSLIAVAGIFIVVFLMAGMVIALFDWRVRDVFFQNKTLRLLYAVGTTGVLLCIYAFYLYVTGKPLFRNPNWALFAGLLLCTVLTLYITHRFEKNRRSMP